MELDFKMATKNIGTLLKAIEDLIDSEKLPFDEFMKRFAELKKQYKAVLKKA